MPGGISSTGLTAIPIPPGGLTGEVLVKLSNATGDYGWGIGGGGGGDVTGLSVIGTVLNLTQSSGTSPITVDLATAGVVFGPAGADTQLQFNNAGAFGASADLTYDGTTLDVTHAVAATPVVKLQMNSTGEKIGIELDGAGIIPPNNEYTALRMLGSAFGSQRWDLKYQYVDDSLRFEIETGAIRAQIGRDTIALGGSYNDPNNAAFTVGETGYGLAGIGDVVISTTLFFDELPASLGTIPATAGRFWVRDDTPPVPMFSTNAGGDNVLAYVGDTVPDTRTLTAGAGLTGGGDLSADRTFDVVANADGSIQVNANDIQVGVLATDAQHGTRGGGTLHPDAVAGGASGFISGADQLKLDNLNLLPAGTVVNQSLRWNGSAWVAESRFQIASGAVQFTDGSLTQQWAIAVNAGDVNWTYANIVDMNVGGGGMTGDFNLFSPLVMSAFATIYMNERTTALGDTAGQGQFWVRDDVPNVPMFTDDAGNDFVLNASGVFGSNFESDFSAIEQSTTSATFVTPYTYTTAALPAGDYMFVWSFDAGGQTDKEASHQVSINGTPVANSEWRIKEGNAGDSKAYLMAAGHRVQTLGAGTATISFQYRANGSTTYIRNKQVSIYRVS